ncbi:MAG: AraC family transcriptional regulator [Eubacteriales bacterium]
MDYKEKKVHGTQDFPVELYRMDLQHPRYEMVCHWHMEFELLRVVKGELNISLNERKYSLSQGDIVFISAGMLHSAIPQGTECVYECVVYNMYYFLTQNDVCNTFVKSTVNYSVLINEYFRDDRSGLRDIVNSLFDAMESESYGYQLTVKGLLYQLLGVIFKEKLYRDNQQQITQGEKRISRLKDVLDLIEESYDTELSLDKLAARAKMTPKYFCAFFKEITNKTPMEYLINYRIEQACMQLYKSELSVTEISYNCGFRDLSYFIKTFKKIKNCTPNGYRKKHCI